MLVLQTNHRAKIECLAFAPDGATLALGGRGLIGVAIFDLATGKERVRFGGHAGPVADLAFAPSGQLVASVDRYGTLRVWEATTGRQLRAMFVNAFGNNCVAISPDGRTVASGCPSWLRTASQVRRWLLPSGVEQPALIGHRAEITAISFAPDGKTLASGSRDHTVRLWDLTTGRERTGFGATVAAWMRQLGLSGTKEALRAMAHRTEIRHLTFSPDGTLLAAATGWGATVWDAATGAVRASWKGHKALVDEVAFSPDGRSLATAGRDGRVRFWDVSGLSSGPGEAAVRSAFDWKVGKVYSVAFAADGLRAAAGGDGGQVVIWDVDGW